MSTAASTAPAEIPDRLAEAKLEKQADGSYRYIHGAVSIPMDFEKLTQAMEQIDKCGPENYKTLARLMGLPTEPFSPKHLRPVLVGGVQIVWHRAHGATEEDLDVVKKKQEGRVSRYLQDLEELKKKPVAPPKSTKIKDEFKGGGGGTRSIGTGKAGAYHRLVPALRSAWEKFDKQKGLVVKAFEIAGGVATTAQLAEIIKAYPPESAMVTNQPVERVVGFYLSEWKKIGLAEIVEAPTQAPEKAEAPPAEEKVEAPPAQEEAPKVDVEKLDTTNGKKKKKGDKK